MFRFLFFKNAICDLIIAMAMNTEETESYRDRKWRREESSRFQTARDVEAMVEDIGFALALTDERKRMPSVYIGVCGRRDAHMPRNVQKDPEASLAWVLKDEVIARGNIYYSKLVKGHAMFLAKRMIPVFNSIYGCSQKGEPRILSKPAQSVLNVLRKEWEMATSDLRIECGFADKKDLTKAIEELQRRMKVVPQEVVYVPKFTYIWTIAEARFPDEIEIKMPREEAVYQLAKCYMSAFGTTQKGELASKFSLSRKEAGEANHRLVDEGFAERIETGVYTIK